METVYLTSLHLKHGGVEFVVSKLANELSKQNMNVVILCTYNFGLPAYAISDKVEIRYLTNLKPNRAEIKDSINSKNLYKLMIEIFRSLYILFFKYFKLAQSFSRIDKGTIIASRHEDAIILSLFGKRTTRKIAHIHFDFKTRPRMERQMRYLYRNIDCVVSLTGIMRDEIRKIFVNQKNKPQVVAIPNFIEKSVYTDDLKKDPIIVAVGRLHNDKGFDRLIKIFAELPNEFPDWTLEIIGDGELKSDLMKIAKEFGVGDQVRFLGSLTNSEVRRKMRTSSVYAMTSISEGFGVVLVEAMEEHLPVIAYDVRVGPRELVCDGVTGYLVPDGDSKLFKEKLACLMQDANLRKIMGTEAAMSARKYHKENVIESWIKVIDENLESIMNDDFSY
ncbi:MAG: glycosyltransferase [Clostridiaceae bacterium]